MIFILFCLNFLQFSMWCGICTRSNKQKEAVFLYEKKINQIKLEYMYTGVYKQFHFTILCVEFHIVL